MKMGNPVVMPPVLGHVYVNVNDPATAYLIEKTKAKVAVVHRLCEALEDYLSFQERDLLEQFEREKVNPHHIPSPMAQTVTVEDLIKARAEVERIQTSLDQLQTALDRDNPDEDNAGMAMVRMGASTMQAMMQPQLEHAKQHAEWVQACLEQQEKGEQSA